MIELHNPKPLGVPYRNTLSHWFTGNTCSSLLVSLDLSTGLAPIKQPASCGSLITEAAGITDDNPFTIFCFHNHLQLQPYYQTL